MPKVYACLTGNWVCLNDDPNCKVGNKGKSPFVWWKEDGEMYDPFEREKENAYAFQPYLRLVYNGISYRIHPSLIQIVEE